MSRIDDVEGRITSELTAVFKESHSYTYVNGETELLDNDMVAAPSFMRSFLVPSILTLPLVVGGLFGYLAINSGNGSTVTTLENQQIQANLLYGSE